MLRRQQKQLFHDKTLDFLAPANNAVLEYPSQVPVKALRYKFSHYPSGIADLAINSA